jgi:ubiquitin fusion degradation protein 1
MKNFGDTKNPILFRILNIQLSIYTHCGVFDFTAEEGTCYLPANMFDRLCLEEGSKVNLRALALNPGTFIKIQPQKTEFINIPEPKKVLEFNLRNYFCVTEGDTISIKFCGKTYKIDILQCKPDKAIRTLNCDLVVDFAPPKDYKEPEPKKPINKVTGSNIKFNSEEKPVKLTKEEIEKTITDKKFSGHHLRIDGKPITQKTAENVIKNKKEKEKAEENYDPRKCRIPSNPRPEFKYVEL